MGFATTSHVSVGNVSHTFISGVELSDTGRYE